MPLISVIIPVYNGEKTIKQTIDSVLKQTFSDFELIVINDGSTDSTLDILASIQDPRLKVFSYPNAGQPASRNRGIAHAIGEYISFIDADDLWTSDKLETQLKALQNNPQAAVAYSSTNWIDESGQFLRQGAYMNCQGYVYAQLLLNDFVESGSNPLIAAYALREVGDFDGSLSNAHDWDMWLRLAMRYHFVCVPSPQILYRISPKSMSSNLRGMEVSSLQVIERCLAQTSSLEHLKQDILGNRYKCLTFSAIEKLSGGLRGLTALRFLCHSVRNDPALLRTRVIWKILFKIAVLSLLPPRLAKQLLTKMNRFSDISALFRHLRYNSLEN